METRNTRIIRLVSQRLLLVALGATVGFSAPSAHGQACSTSAPGLVSWWPADADSLDVQSAHDAVLMNGTTFAPGILPGTSAFSFDGVDDYVSVAATPDLGMTSSYSFEAWIDSTGPSSHYRVIAIRGAGNQNDIEIYIQAASNDLAVVHNRGNGGPTDYVGFADPPAGLFHLAVTYDGSIVRAFYDGVEPAIVQVSAAMAPPSYTNKGWEFGRTLHPAFGAPRHFRGTIDEISLYNQALSASDVQAIVDAGPHGKCRDDDGDGLLNEDELALGTNPNDADTDSDGLDDGTEVMMADGSGCPSPLDLDSDGDTLADGEEVVLGTNTCSADTDSDGVSDAVDPSPTEAGVPGSFIEEWTRMIAAQVELLDLDTIDAKKDRARAGRRNAMASKLNGVANLVASGEYDEAIDKLESLGRKLDGERSPKDWMVDCPERDWLLSECEGLIVMIEFLL